MLDLGPIKERCAAAKKTHSVKVVLASTDDVPALVAEIERLRAELPALLDELTPYWREETDDPLAAVRGIIEDKARAWDAVKQSRAEAAEVRAKAFEEAAKVAERCASPNEARDITAALRAKAKE